MLNKFQVYDDVVDQLDDDGWDKLDWLLDNWKTSGNPQYLEDYELEDEDDLDDWDEDDDWDDDGETGFAEDLDDDGFDDDGSTGFAKHW